MSENPLADYQPNTKKDAQAQAADEFNLAAVAHGLTVHEMASIPPFVVGAEFEALKSSLKAVGQSYPIKVTSQNVLLDGRNRLRALHAINQEPKFDIDDRDPQMIIISSARTRQITPGQRAMIAYLQSGVKEVEAAKARKVRKGEASDTTEFNVFEKRGWRSALQSEAQHIQKCIDDPKIYIIKHDENGVRFDVPMANGDWLEVRKPVTGKVRQHIANMHAVNVEGVKRSQAIHTGSLTEPFAAKLVKQIVDGTISLEAGYQEWLKWSSETISSSGEGEVVFDAAAESETLDKRLEASIKQYRVLIENGMQDEASKMAALFMQRIGSISGDTK